MPSLSDYMVELNNLAGYAQYDPWAERERYRIEHLERERERASQEIAGNRYRRQKLLLLEEP